MQVKHPPPRLLQETLSPTPSFIEKCYGGEEPINSDVAIWCMLGHKNSQRANKAREIASATHCSPLPAMPRTGWLIPHFPPYIPAPTCSSGGEWVSEPVARKAETKQADQKK